MKRFVFLSLVLLLSAVLALALAGCSGGGGGGGDDDTTDDDIDDDTEEPPAAPSDLTATGSGQDITLNWSDNSDNEDGFYVYRREYGETDFEQLAELGADSTEYTDAELDIDKDYEYKVTAFNSVGESEDSNVARAQTVPSAPSSLSAFGGGTTITLNWQDNSNVENGFKIYYRPYGSGSFSFLTNAAPNSTFYVHNAGAEKNYEYKLTAFNDAGESDESNTANAQTLAPNAPTNLTVSDTKKYRTTISWTDNSSIEDYYKVERRLSSKDDWQEIATLPANTTSYTDTELNCQTGYEYRVRALNDNYYSDYSNTASMSTLNCWTIYTLESVGNFGGYTSIALDSSDHVHISYSYYDYNYNKTDLKYATNASGSWQYFVINPSISSLDVFTSIALDSTDKVHIAYAGPAAYLKYATNSSGNWQIFSLESSPSNYPSIAVSSDGQVHISYHEIGLVYATNASGIWQKYTVDSSNYYLGLLGTSIALDSNDKVHISYNDYTNYDLKYATNASGSWQYFTLDSAGDVGWYNSIALDSNNKVHISYYADYPNYDLKYATSSSGSWQTFTLDSAETVGLYTSIVLDSNDYVHISCASSAGLKHVTNASGAWQSYVVDASGTYTSIALDSNDYVHISYYDSTNDYLKYATNAEVE